MKVFTWFLAFSLVSTYSSTAEAADIYTVTCPKCNYSARLRSGGTKRNHNDPPSVYFCTGEKKLVSLPASWVRNGKTVKGDCQSTLKPFDPLKKNQTCPVCGGKIVISDHATAC